MSKTNGKMEISIAPQVCANFCPLHLKLAKALRLRWIEKYGHENPDQSQTRAEMLFWVKYHMVDIRRNFGKRLLAW